MLITGLRLASLVLASFTLGLAVCHAVGVPSTILGAVGAAAETGAAASAVALTVLLRRRRSSFGLTLTGAACLVAALIFWFGVVNPVSVWTAESADGVPLAWTVVRDGRAYAHVVHALLLFVGYVGLVLSVLAETHRPRVTATIYRQEWQPLVPRRNRAA
jgi:hypothetical protein